MELNLLTSSMRNTDFRTQNWSRGDYDAMRHDLMQIDWSGIFSTRANVEDFWASFKNILKSLVKSYVPMTLHKKNGPKVTKPIRNVQAEKQRLHSLLRKDPSNSSIRQKFREISKKLKGCHFSHVAGVEEKILSSNNIQKFFKYVSRRFKSKESVAPLRKDVGGSIVDDSASKADILNKAFASVFTRDNGILPNIPTIPGLEELRDVDITEEGIVKHINSFKNLTSMGPDGLPPFLLKKLRFELARPLRTIFEVSLRTGRVPDDWTLATITPVYKGNGSRHDGELPTH